MVLEQNVFVENVLPGSVLRGLTETEMAEYRRPYLNSGEDRRPTLTWPRQIPIAGEPEDVVKIVGEYFAWLQVSEVPKLFVAAEPGALVTGPLVEMVQSWPAVTSVTVPGAHFIQEDSHEQIGAALLDWHGKL